ncbi:RNA polymerase II elongation factor ELL2-like [Porphyrio hochstetteri]
MGTVGLSDVKCLVQASHSVIPPQPQAQEHGSGINPLQQADLQSVVWVRTKPSVRSGSVAWGHLDSDGGHLLLAQVSFSTTEQCSLLRIPKVDVPDQVQTINICTSDAGSDNPQGSFGCVQQAHSSSGASQLSCLGPAQSKITVCATSDSHQTTRERVTQAEEESHNPSAKVINPGRTPLGKRPPVRKPRPSSPDLAPERKRSTPLNPALLIRKIHTPDAVSQRPYRERVMHLLALRSYKEPELLARLQKDSVNQDKNCLASILQQVANLNPKDNSYTLKDYLYTEIKKDWPGYSEIDKQLLKLKLRGCDKRPMNSGYIDPLIKKRRISHLASRTNPLYSGQFSASSETAAATAPPSPPSLHLTVLPTFSPLQAATSSSPSTPEGQGTQDLPADCSSQKSQSLCENQQHKQSSPTAWGPSAPAAKCPPKPAQEKPGLLHTTRAKEEKPDEATAKHSFTVELQTKELQETEKPQFMFETSPAQLKQDKNALNLPVTCYLSVMAGTMQPIKLQKDSNKYTAVESYRQRESYKDDFNVEYGEYRALHARVESVVQQFVELDAQHKLLSPGTKEHQKPTLETGAEPPVCLPMNGADVDVKDSLGSVSETQRAVAWLEALGWLRLRQLPHMLGMRAAAHSWAQDQSAWQPAASTPSYDQVKSRCQYLHNKLSHIKRLVEEFNKHQAELWHQSLARKNV